MNLNEFFKNKNTSNFSNIINSLVKLACYQNNIDLNNLTSEDQAQLEKIGKTLTSKVLFNLDSLPKEDKINKYAEEITKKLVSEGLLNTSEVFPKLEELRCKSIEDLTVFDKAIDLYKKGEVISLGTLVENSSIDLSPKEKFYNFLTENN